MLTKLPQHLLLRKAVPGIRLHHDSHCDYGRTYGFCPLIMLGYKL